MKLVGGGWGGGGVTLEKGREGVGSAIVGCFGKGEWAVFGLCETERMLCSCW